MGLRVYDINGGVKTASSGTVVTSVTASGELASSGGATPDISIDAFPNNEFLAGPTSGGPSVPTSRFIASSDIIAGSMTPIIGIAIFSYEVAAGTNGGTYTASSYATRPLNTTRMNTIPSASLASNVISLPAGTYRAAFWVNGYATNSFVYRLRNTTDGTTLSVGLTGNNATINIGISWDDFVLGGTKSIELQQAGSTTRATDGMGTPANLTETEVYAIVMIERIA